MRPPNFFIIGAPKCGTTSLASWLSTHPRIYMSPAKEPHHFDSDHQGGIQDRTQYERLFRGATTTHSAIGEASVWYLYSREAVGNIEAYAPGARYVVCLRNPVEMVYSLHEQSLANGTEHIRDVSEAWKVWEKRARGQAISRWCKEPRHLAYGAACSLGAQLERLFEQVPSARVFTILLDDLKFDAPGQYRNLLAFLGVENDGRSEFPVLNPAKSLRSSRVRQSVRLLGIAKERLGVERSFGLLAAINQMNTRYRPRPPMGKRLLEELQFFFEPDVTKLSGLLGRDLSHWLRNAP